MVTLTPILWNLRCFTDLFSCLVHLHHCSRLLLKEVRSKTIVRRFATSSGIQHQHHTAKHEEVTFPFLLQSTLLSKSNSVVLIRDDVMYLYFLRHIDLLHEFELTQTEER